MAKKIKRIIVSAAHHDVLVQKADFLDELFGDGDALYVKPGAFKGYEKLAKAFDKLSSIDIEEYVEPKPAKKGAKAATAAG